MKNLLLTFSLLPSLAFGFSDVTIDHDQYEAIKFMQEEQIVDGYPDGTFRPQVEVNRGEFMKFVTLINQQRLPEHFEDSMCIYIMSGCDEDIKQCFPYSDVQISDWYASYICRGASQNFLEGYPDGTFRPSNCINFVEASKILSKLFKLEGNFPETDIWYENDVRALAQKSAIPKSIKAFDHKITRGEMAEIIYRLKLNITDKANVTFKELR